MDDLPLGGETAAFTSALRSMESRHRPLLMLRTKVVMVGDATVGKSALAQVWHSNGHAFPKNYVMVRAPSRALARAIAAAAVGPGARPPL